MANSITKTFLFNKLSSDEFVSRLTRYGFNKGKRLSLTIVYHDCQLTYEFNIPSGDISTANMTIKSNVGGAPIAKRAQLIIQRVNHVLTD